MPLLHLFLQSDLLIAQLKLWTKLERTVFIPNHKLWLLKPQLFKHFHKKLLLYLKVNLLEATLMRILPSESAMGPQTLEDALKLTLSPDLQQIQLFHHQQETEPKVPEVLISLLQTLPLKVTFQLDPQVLPPVPT